MEGRDRLPRDPCGRATCCRGTGWLPGLRRDGKGCGLTVRFSLMRQSGSARDWFLRGSADPSSRHRGGCCVASHSPDMDGDRRPPRCLSTRERPHMSGLDSHDYGSAVPCPLPRSAQELVRRLASRLLTDHPRGADGFCQTCRPRRLYPCVARRLAIVGLVTAGRRHSLAQTTPTAACSQTSRSGELR
jgi:hypothetical protein